MVHAAEGTLQAYLDGEIDSAAEGALREHVAACASCAAEMETLRRASGVVGQSLALLDSPAPMLRAQAAIARERHGAGRRVAGLGVRSLAKAAMLALVLAGAGAAAIIPDVRRAIETTFSRVVAMFGGGQDDTAAVPAQPAPTDVAPGGTIPSESFVAPSDGRVTIAIEAAGSDALEVIVRLVDGPQAHVATATTASVSRRVGSGSLELRDLGAGTVTIGLPRSAREARVEVNGRVHVYKEEGELRGPDAAGRGSEVRFTVGS